MKAVWYERTGPAREVLQHGEFPTPSPGRGQVLIRIHASGVNPSDAGMRAGPAPMAYPRIIPNSDGAGVVEAVEGRGAVVVNDGDADAVLVGFHREFDYERLRIAATAVLRGARLLATNDDATYPTPDGPIPGGGAILASVAVASGVSPLVAGKPHHAMADLVRGLLGSGMEHAVMVGDRPSTDGGFAASLGCRFALVRSGVTPTGVLPTDEPSWFVGTTLDIDVPNLAGVADFLLK